MNSEINLEREQIKKLFSEMLERLIDRRKIMTRRRSKHVVAISDLERLQKNFFWYVDNPDYKRTENKRNDVHQLP